jgi:hypothetical protein
MIVDACHSAAAIESGDFKPGPMGSRGLGQLAYDKGMLILAAAQKSEFALEVEQLEHGLLTYALLVDGVIEWKADHNPRDKQLLDREWLRYGILRVPEIYDDIRDGRRSLSRSKLNADVKDRNSAQQPALFDFITGRQSRILLNQSK